MALVAAVELAHQKQSVALLAGLVEIMVAAAAALVLDLAEVLRVEMALMA